MFQQVRRKRGRRAESGGDGEREGNHLVEKFKGLTQWLLQAKAF